MSLPKHRRGQSHRPQPTPRPGKAQLQRRSIPLFAIFVMLLLVTGLQMMPTPGKASEPVESSNRSGDAQLSRASSRSFRARSELPHQRLQDAASEEPGDVDFDLEMPDRKQHTASEDRDMITGDDDMTAEVDKAGEEAMPSNEAMDDIGGILESLETEADKTDNLAHLAPQKVTSSPPPVELSQGRLRSDETYEEELQEDNPDPELRAAADVDGAEDQSILGEGDTEIEIDPASGEEKEMEEGPLSEQQDDYVKNEAVAGRGEQERAQEDANATTVLVESKIEAEGEAHSLTLPTLGEDVEAGTGKDVMAEYHQKGDEGVYAAEAADETSAGGDANAQQVQENDGTQDTGNKPLSTKEAGAAEELGNIDLEFGADVEELRKMIASRSGDGADEGNELGEADGPDRMDEVEAREALRKFSSGHPRTPVKRKAVAAAGHAAGALSSSSSNGAAEGSRTGTGGAGSRAKKPGNSVLAGMDKASLKELVEAQLRGGGPILKQRSSSESKVSKKAGAGAFRLVSLSGSKGGTSGRGSGRLSPGSGPHRRASDPQQGQRGSGRRPPTTKDEGEDQEDQEDEGKNMKPKYLYQDEETLTEDERAERAADAERQRLLEIERKRNQKRIQRRKEERLMAERIRETQKRRAESGHEAFEFISR